MASVGAALPKLPFEIIPEAPFYIPATGPATRPRCTLKHDDTFLVVDSHGDVGASAGGSDGLFHCDTRFLSHLELLLNGTQPLLLGSNVRDDNTQLTVDLTNPDVYFEHRLVLPKDTLHVVRTIFLWRDTAYQRLGIQNHGDRAVDLRLTMLFDSDFADLFEVRGLQRERRGAGTRQVVRPGTTVLSYKGLDAQLRQTVLSFDPPPTEITATTASYRLTLAPKQVTSICCTIGCAGARATRGPSQSARRFEQRRHRRDLERPPQRGVVPLDVRSLHADDQHAARTLSLRRHSLVLDHVRPRWIDHCAADALVRSAHRARRAPAARRLPGHGRRPGVGRATGKDFA
jgi:glycogen debranching enzyme